MTNEGKVGTETGRRGGKELLLWLGLLRGGLGLNGGEDGGEAEGGDVEETGESREGCGVGFDAKDFFSFGLNLVQGGEEDND